MRSSGAESNAKIGRKRRIAGWAMLSVGVVVGCAWGASRWWCFGKESERWTVMVGRGSVYLEVRPAAYAAPHGWWAGAYTAGLNGAVGQSPAPSGWKWFPDVDQFPMQWYMPVPDVNGSVFLYRAHGTGWVGGNWDTRQYALALWPVFPVLLAGGGLALRSGVRVWRRVARGCCLRCGYDLAGLADRTVCPECGKETAK